MDSLIKRFDCVADNDLMLAEARGVAWQRKMGAARVAYDAKYLAKFEDYDPRIAAQVNAGRSALLQRHLPAGAKVLDYGAGDGGFMQAAAGAGFAVRGFEVIPEVATQLKEKGLWGDNPEHHDATCFWDVLEHLDDPELILRQVQKGKWIFVSIPIFTDLRQIRQSRHYRPGEHLYYFTEQGLVDWLALWGFRLLEISRHEIDAGREAIGAFAFIRDLPDRDDYIWAYNQMHAARYYGASATELYLDVARRAVAEIKPKSILDYGCGRSDLVAHFYLDGKRRIARYDPAINAHKTMPDGKFDFIICLDVMEHIPMAAVDNVLREIRHKAAKAALFSISLKPSRAKFPDGRNCHCTLLTRSEWLRWLKSYFGDLTIVDDRYPTELVVLARTG